MKIIKMTNDDYSKNYFDLIMNKLISNILSKYI